VKVEWYHVAGAAALGYWAWHRHTQQVDELTAAAAAAAGGVAKAQADADAEHQAALAARQEVNARDRAAAAQQDITAQTVGAISGTVRVVLPPVVNAPPRVVTSPPAAAAGETTLAKDANSGEIRIVPKEGSLSIVRDPTFGQTPTAYTEQRAQAAPLKKMRGLSVPGNIDELRKLR